MKTAVKILVVMVTAIIIGLFMAFPVMWLWNWLMPKILGLITISFWEALGLTLLCSFLFKSSNSSSN